MTEQQRTDLETAHRLDRIARVDGYRVRLAKDGNQRWAWCGVFGVFDGACLLFTANSPYRVRGWLYDAAKRGPTLG
jgi:hypothetical protein